MNYALPSINTNSLELHNKQQKLIAENSSNIDINKIILAHNLTKTANSQWFFNPKKYINLYKANDEFYKAYNFKDSKFSINANYFLSGMLWGTNTISRLNISGINSYQVAIIKQFANIFVGPLAGSFFDMMVGGIGNKFALKYMPVLDKSIEQSQTYNELLIEYNKLFKDIQNIESNMPLEEFEKKFNDLDLSLLKQNANNKYAFWGLGGVFRSITNVAIVSLLSTIVLKNKGLSLEENAIAISMSFVALCIASGFDRINQHFLMPKYNLECSEILQDIHNKLQKNPDYELTQEEASNIQNTVFKWIKQEMQIKKDLVTENYEYRLAKLISYKQKHRQTSRDNPEFINHIEDLKNQIAIFEFDDWKDLDLDSSIAKDLLSTVQLYKHNLPANWFKDHAMLSQICKNYGNSLQGIVLAPMIWSIIADIARYSFKDKELGLQIFAVGKIFSGVLLALSNMSSSSARKQVKNLIRKFEDSNKFYDKNICTIDSYTQVKRGSQHHSIDLSKYNVQYNRLVSLPKRVIRTIYGIAASTTPLFTTPYNIIKINNLKNKIMQYKKQNYTQNFELQ